MKLMTIKKNGNYRLGIKTDKGILEVESILNKDKQSSLPTEIMTVIQNGEEAVGLLETYVKEVDASQLLYLSESEVEWGPCVTDPEKIICVGLNYRRHADETGASYPESPILFSKFNNTLTGHNNDIFIPKTTEQLDYEVELGIVIGRRAKDVSEEEALNYVFGYCAANDLSARDLQFKTNQWLLGKTCDGFSPVGPYLVTTNEVENPNNLKLKTVVNGEERQNSNTSDMIFSCKELISYISHHMTLEPGDLILTGTPEGVILGEPEDERNYLKPGDVVTAEIEGVGALTNRMI
ncbi:2-hydroxyhepta-2,4-diene-1,7-dioate isomerase [Thalassobacillus devorans]|uniref:2-hydroxyhepta-2,4-diene-1,7-dioate isomerase n=1 Tax=Thalassobacillus devorans TaxID=279813 RepID=A0ABQ1P1V1_9BACI|nr:fumarylacetoacetate hydrolase family protein [Thalassobacillus devorans]NIK28021.1 2-keto-4-pentenoate hydratase/2-oxohepta-3-ene-1,7-dioic acid hydratase in catechol pathway [Thalassobacillus devorans]GGC89526.1 2-hydroxyhepta-2,4-diene-1,7-dioate isomerase [Thalassobacillus devorans]